MRRTLIITALLICSLQAMAGGPILQYFECRWDTIEKKLPDVFVAGYGALWLPPPGKGDSGGYTVGYDVYDRFNLGTPFDQTLYGTEAGARQLVRKAHDAGLNVYFDFVANHNGFRDLGTPGFAASGGYPGFAVTLPYDIDGDFHGAYASGLWEARVAGLIDIAHEKNNVFIRQPVSLDARNIPIWTPDPANARFYPDLGLAADPSGIHPFNTADPMAGDAVPENATGLLMRNAQWLIEVIGADGLRLDAVRHMPPWFFSDFLDKVLYHRGRRDLAGNPTTPFTFGEDFTGDFNELRQYARKDGYGNRDVLDFPLFFALGNVLNANGLGDMRQLEYASVDGMDGNANDGTYGVSFVQSHDSFGPSLDNLAYAFILTRTGVPVVYFNALEFGTGRDFPKGGRGDALGGAYGNLVPRMVDVARRYAKGAYYTRWIDSDVYVYERSNSLLVGLNDRADSGYDERSVDTAFRNVTLAELSGNAADPVVNANNDIPRTITIGADGRATIRVPRNTTNSANHKCGFVLYGIPSPLQTQIVSPIASTLGPDPSSVPNGTRRLTPLQVVTGNTFTVDVSTSTSVPEDNALIKIDGGLPIDANPGLFLTSGEFAGFEEFTNLHSPRATGGSGAYRQTVDASGLADGLHFIETVAFAPRSAGSPPAYSSARSVIYLDRVPPPIQLAYPSTNGTSDVMSQSYTIVTRCPDMTADSMHVFFDMPAGYDFRGNVNASNKMTRVDRNEFRFTWNNPANGAHSITVVAFEPTGNSNVQRFEPIGVAVPQPNMALGIDANDAASTVDFQPFPSSITVRSYPHDLVVRVDRSTGLQFPRDYDVWLEIDGKAYPASAYDAALLPPINRLVQNDQNLGDAWEEFHMVWRGYAAGNHNVVAHASLKSGAAAPNEVSSICNVPDTVVGPVVYISSPAPGTTFNRPYSLTIGIDTDFSARSVLAYIYDAQSNQLVRSVNLPTSTHVDFNREVTNRYETDSLTGLDLENGVYTIKAVAATGLDGAGLRGEAVTTVSITGFIQPPDATVPQVDGSISDMIDKAPLAISASDGGGASGTVADFGADGSLTELHARVANRTLYLAVRGDMFNGTDPNLNATIIYIDCDVTSATGARQMTTTSDLSDTADHMRQLVSNSGFKLNTALVSQGVGFDAAVVIDGSSPLAAAAYGFGSGGVAGSKTSFASLQAPMAFGRGNQVLAKAAGTTIAAPSVFEVSIPLSVLGNANPLDMGFVVVTTSDTSYPSPNTLPENAQNTFDTVQVIDSIARFARTPRLVLNEICNGALDYVEVHNSTSSTLSLDGWRLVWSNGNGVSAGASLNGTVFADAYNLFYDSTDPSAPTGAAQLPYNIAWDSGSAGSAALVDPYGIAADYVRWTSLGGAQSGDTSPPGTTFSGWGSGFNGAAAQVLGRDAASTDSNTAADWSIQIPTPGAVNRVTAVDPSLWTLY